jgi:hypothetical protein
VILAERLGVGRKSPRLTAERCGKSKAFATAAV